MDKSTDINCCAYCLDFFDQTALISITYNNHITIPIKFLFCRACFAKIAAGDEKINATMWERYAKLLPYEEERQYNQLQRFIDKKNILNAD